MSEGVRKMGLSRPNNTVIEVDKDVRKQLKILSANTGIKMQDLANAAILHLAELYEIKPECFQEIVE